VIVRISTEGQYRLADDDEEQLNELDNAVVAAVDAGDAEAFTERFSEMLDFVRQRGDELGDDELEESDVILPPPDTTIDEAAHEFTGDGLIPD
jgi:hypothetical protein